MFRQRINRARASDIYLVQERSDLVICTVHDGSTQELLVESSQVEDDLVSLEWTIMF